jgi:hypothetical protein
VVCESLLRRDRLVMPRVAALVRVGPHAGFLIRHGSLAGRGEVKLGPHARAGAAADAPAP